MILEGIVTTSHEDGTPNVSPMGPEVCDSGQWDTFVLKPYTSSRTYQNLKRQGRGIFHITDDVMLLACAAINVWSQSPEFASQTEVAGHVLANACQWFEFEVTSLEDSEQRTRIECRVLQQRQIRPFFGFNRAKHAVLEAAILATRTKFIPAGEILSQMKHLKVIVGKTAGQQETDAFQLLEQFIAAQLSGCC
ncbi:MAG: hypothetical protein CMJ79_10140 [Planctomycetaceae bacterium]|jgi:hypothetical protein|nr:hypothetical protein [Planctomycetaceae bacterium]|tara:strand:- start:8781 stop:9359 length:579 start_codon:yes stop_codon:yes gene_type:complete